MKKIALGLVAAAAIFTAAPAMAQIGFYAGLGGRRWRGRAGSVLSLRLRLSV